jgi:hypothetical protein
MQHLHYFAAHFCQFFILPATTADILIDNGKSENEA